MVKSTLEKLIPKTEPTQLSTEPTPQPKVEKTPEQIKSEQSDNLVAMKARYNSIRGNATAKKAALRQEISAKAKELGATIELDPKSGKMEILNEKGKKLIRSKQENTAKPLEERSPEFQSFYEKIKGDLKLNDTSIDNHKIDVGLSQKEINKAVDDIANGKHNLNTSKLLDGLEAMHDSGGIDFTQGDGLTVSKTSVPMDEYFDAKNQDLEYAYDDLTEDERNEIEDEIIKNTKVVGETDWNAVQESFANKSQTNKPQQENEQERVSTTDNTTSKKAEPSKSDTAKKGEQVEVKPETLNIFAKAKELNDARKAEKSISKKRELAKERRKLLEENETAKRIDDNIKKINAQLIEAGIIEKTGDCP